MSTTNDSLSNVVTTDISIISMDTDNDDDIDLFATNKYGNVDLTESCPDIYRCPISKELMTKPVMLHADGQTYDEEPLKEWLSENNRSPLTGVDLSNKSFSRNYALQSAIEQFESAKKAHFEKQKCKTPERSTSNMDISEEKKSAENIIDSVSNDKLKEFLSSIALAKYMDNFINAGFVSMNDFANITFNDLMAMNIPIIHSRRMMKAINEYNAQQKQSLNLNDDDDHKQKLTDIPLTNSIIIRPGRIPKSHNSAPLNCNILLLGDAYVGKTSLRKRLELDDFVATQATQGVELTCLLSNFRGEDLQITIWDPAGQERYAPITKTFFRRAHAAAIIFSADDVSTWKHVEFWMNELEQNAPDDIETMLICNKVDLLQGKNGDIELSDLVKKAVDVAAKRRIPFFTTSAKSGESVNLAFQELVNQLLNNEAILDKLYEQRDGTLMKQSSYRGASPYDNGSDDDDVKEDKKRGGKMNRIKKRLSWRSKKNESIEYKEYTQNDYDKNINLNDEFRKERNVNASGGSCCSR